MLPPGSDFGTILLQQRNRAFRLALFAALLLGATEPLAAANCPAGYSVQNGYCRPLDYPYFRDRSRGYHFRRSKEEFTFSGSARPCPKGFTIRDDVCISRGL
jgi:hypothetical protein